MASRGEFTQLWIAPIPALDELLERAEEVDLRAVAECRGDNRKREILAWRALVRRHLGCDVVISYNENGAPTLNDGGYISVSHNSTHVAVAYSKERVCGVDIESEQRNFSAIISRYLTREELSLLNHAAWCCIAWSAKETLYKLAQERGLNFLEDIRLHRVELISQADKVEECNLVPLGRIECSVKRRDYLLNFAPIDGGWVVWY